MLTRGGAICLHLLYYQLFSIPAYTPLPAGGRSLKNSFCLESTGTQAHYFREFFEVSNPLEFHGRWASV